ncbi:hypothetical protein ACIGHE_11120 [Staphylococcus pasteuri]|uniref:hypothetical protein n=1 Tax=Staphylococcus TaxID=1279 RepID=UPI0008A15347|nr:MULTISPECIES: hypothetical protein [Staphylococcus]OFV13004.1 hypothetical protein HMPREF3125_01785 [Staphylococcus sp. HMSC13A10]
MKKVLVASCVFIISILTLLFVRELGEYFNLTFFNFLEEPYVIIGISSINTLIFYFDEIKEKYDSKKKIGDNIK